MKDKIKQLLLLSSKQLLGYLVVGISVVIGGIPALLMTFYFVFYFEGSFTETGISIFVWMAVLSALVAFVFRIVKIQRMKYKEPVIGAIPRAIEHNKYPILLAIMYTVFTMKFSTARMMTFIWIVVGLRAVSKILEGVSLKLFDMDWSDE